MHHIISLLRDPVNSATGQVRATSLKKDVQNFRQCLLIPANKFACLFNTAFAVLIFPVKVNRIDNSMPYDGHIVCCVTFPDIAPIFAKADIQHPVKLVFDTPMLPYRPSYLSRIRPSTADVIAIFMAFFITRLTM